MKEEASEKSASYLQKSLVQGNKELFSMLYDTQQSKEGVTQQMAALFTEKDYSADLSDLAATDYFGKNALHYAIAGDQNVKMLPRLEVLVGQQDTFGLTPLMLAAKMNRVYWINALLPRESCLRDNRGRTALMYAAYGSNFDVLERLFEHEWFILDGNNCSVLSYLWQQSAQYAKYHEQFEQKLLSFGIPSGCLAKKSRSKIPQISAVRALYQRLVGVKSVLVQQKCKFFEFYYNYRRARALVETEDGLNTKRSNLYAFYFEEAALRQEIEQKTRFEKENANLQIYINALRAVKFGALPPAELIKSSALLPAYESSENATPTSLELSNSIQHIIPTGVADYAPYLTFQQRNTTDGQLTAAQRRRREMQARIKETLREVQDM